MEKEGFFFIFLELCFSLKLNHRLISLVYPIIWMLCIRREINSTNSQ